MQGSLTLSDIIMLFGAMAVLAAIPSVSVLVVSARSAASGFLHGIFAAMGIVAGDIFFILLAIFGLAVLVETLGEWFVLVKYLGGAYLVWLGILIWQSESPAAETEQRAGGGEVSLWSSFLSGLLLTLGDQKAILFYLGFFPAFLDLSVISWFDIGIVMVITVFAVGGVKIAYACMASRAGMLVGPVNRRVISMIAGGILTAIGVFLIVQA